MKRSLSSHQWLKRQQKDFYVKEALRQGWRSRASFKLLELQEKYHFIKEASGIIDLGCAPGGWSQVASQQSGKKGFTLGVDLLPMDPIDYVEFIQGDFTDDHILQSIMTQLAGRKVDIVLSDMAPNMSGIKLVDQAKSIYLAELALEFASNLLCNKGEGVFVVKLFHGVDFDNIIREIRARFSSVKVIKPKSSRAESKEVYAIAQFRK